MTPNIREHAINSPQSQKEVVGATVAVNTIRENRKTNPIHNQWRYVFTDLGAIEGTTDCDPSFIPFVKELRFRLTSMQLISI
jgi:hypothetical protein